MFKTALLYRIEHWTPPEAATVEERLAAVPFIECGASQPESMGWVEPRGARHGALLENIGGQWMLKLGLETKAVPASAVKTQLEPLLDQAEKDTGRRPRGKRVKEMKEAVVHALLPRAFPKRSDTLVWIDSRARLLVVGAGSIKAADRVVTQLLQTLGGDLKLALLQTQLSPATAMATWLSQKEAPAGFSIDRECELKQPDSEKSAVRYARHTLDIDEVAEHIKQGKLPTQVAMTWNSRVSFVLTDALVLKKINVLDVALEGAGAAAGAAVSNADGAEGDNGFDADVAITTGELQQLIPALVEALGGLLKEPAAAGAATPAATPTATPTAQSPTPESSSSRGTEAAATADEAPPW